ncbi:MAG: aspartate-semialdehyde dehydrogenase [Acetobacteraceae bacterium]|nr:aspartate-semialdehyde dehydrogenase [Acetobacteraceae bacterium]
MSSAGGLRVAVLGAAGVVGGEILRALDLRGFPCSEVLALATARSAGARLVFRGSELEVTEASPQDFSGVDLAFFAATVEASRALAPEAVARGAVVIDKSSAFRLDPGVPLVVPEVNPDAVREHRGVLASPNCTTIQLVVALEPLRQAAGLRRVVVSSYQSVSGSGREAVVELEEQVRWLARGEGPLRPGRVPPGMRRVYPRPIAFDVLPHIDSFDPSGYTGEEVKVREETRKIMGLPDLPICATCVRVPVFVGHALSVWVETEQPLGAAGALEALARAPGVALVDDPARAVYPTPGDAEGRDEVLVGRVRDDPSCPNGLLLWIAADNLRKGAATNAVQIAELLLGQGLPPGGCGGAGQPAAGGRAR